MPDKMPSVSSILPVLASGSSRPPLTVIDDLIKSGKKILYNGEDFKDDRIVTKFVAEHKPLRTAMVGTNVFMYIDPCHCCIPGHGARDYKPQPVDVTSFIRYIREAKEKREPLDLVFTSLYLYEQGKGEIEKISPETKLIVGCDRKSTTSASELRRRGIPAIDDNDYNNCSPLNAVIAFTVFDLVVSGDIIH